MLNENLFFITHFNKKVEKFNEFHGALLSNTVAKMLHIARLSLVNENGFESNAKITAKMRNQRFVRSFN